MSCVAEIQIEDPRNHSEETVLALKDVLCGGATLIPDPKRRGLYEVRRDSQVYYIHVSPVTGNIMLLATWAADIEKQRAN